MPGTGRSCARMWAQNGLVACLILGVLVPAGCTPVGAPSRAGAPALGAPRIDGAPIGLEGLDATLWVQTSAEYAATATQAYDLARLRLDEALADPTWTAALEQRGAYEALPAAVILDVDETVLDNSYNEARLILEQGEFGSEGWDQWVEERAATPVPGALEFCRAAAELGVTVFYVSNRDAHLEEATRDNLAALGLPIVAAPDAVLLRGEKGEWGSDKGSRRAEVANAYRILLLIGDNLGDFVSVGNVELEEHRRIFDEHRDRWGRHWIALPNPQYGSWQGSAVGFDYDLPWPEKIELMKGALDPKR